MSASDRNRDVMDAIYSGAQNFYQKPLRSKDLSKFLLAAKQKNLNRS